MVHVGRKTMAARWRPTSPKPVETIVIDDQDESGTTDIAALQDELSLINDSIDMARKKHQKSDARRHQEQLDLHKKQLELINRHAAEKQREVQQLETLLDEQKEVRARLSNVLQSSRTNGGFSGHSASQIKSETGLKNTTDSYHGSTGTQIITPQSASPDLLSSPEVEETLGCRTEINSKVDGTQDSPLKTIGNSSGHSSSHKSSLRARNEHERLLEAFGVKYGQPATRSSTVKASSTAKVKVEDHESDGVIPPSDEDDEPLVQNRLFGANTPSSSRRGVSITTSSNGVQYTIPARSIKRERHKDDELLVTSPPPPKRIQRQNRVTSAADGRRIKMEDGELVPWPVRMPPYIKQLIDFSLKLNFPETNYKFSRAFLTMCLGGNPCETRPKVGQKRRENQIYDVDEYHCWSPDWNPHVPPKRGVHGASLSIDVWDGEVQRLSRRQRVTLEDGSEATNEDLQVPLHTFCKRRDCEFEYVGLYTQGRCFERLTNEEYETDVPEKTRAKWAENIVVKEWGATMLIEGGIVRTKEEAKSLSPAAIRVFMDKPDDEPGKKLRFFWRYLECVGYDENFYEALAAKGREKGYTTKPDNAPYEFGHFTRFELADAADAADSTMPTRTSATSSGSSNQSTDVTMTDGDDEVKKETKPIMQNPRSLYEDSD